VDNAGCTLPETPGPVELQGVHFAFDSSELTADSTATLDAVVGILQGHPDLMVEIAGHTDDTGPTEYNQGLSERRAQAVLDYLVSHGVNADNITARGYGELEPVADNGTREGRAANRRVELQQK
jgi:OOP family OmpA-OmpF porin